MIGVRRATMERCADAAGYIGSAGHHSCSFDGMVSGGTRGRMGTVSKLIITTLLAWTFIVGPLAAVTAGISLVRSLYPASALTKPPDRPVGAPEFRGSV